MIILLLLFGKNIDLFLYIVYLKKEKLLLTQENSVMFWDKLNLIL